MTATFNERPGVNALLLIVVSVCLLPSCTKNQSVSPAIPNNSIRIFSSANFGNIVTDSSGKTLYFFSNDANGTSSCSGPCLLTWPVFYKANPTMDTGFKSSDFATITRADGLSQTTFKGWPLYYFKPDSVPGDIKGDGVGKLWFVAKPDYSVMLSKNQLVGKDSIAYDSTYKPGVGKTVYLTDGLGRTLYSFSPDHFKKNNYTKSDFSNNAFWPINEVSVIQGVPSVLDKALFDTLHVFGKVHLTFKGWPLYFFGPDNNQRGKTLGISVPRPGFWPVVNQYSPAAPQ